MTSPGYLQYPHINGDFVTFVAADDVWLAPVAGGRAWRFTADLAPVSTPRFAPDGSHLAWASGRAGGADVYVASVSDGAATRLSYWAASAARVCGWTAGGEVLAVSAAAQPFRHYSWARTLGSPLSGGTDAERLLPFGPVADVSLGASGALDGMIALLNGTMGGFREPAHWKRYRGGTAGRLWLRSERASDETPFRRMMAGLRTQFASPMIAGGRLAFLSDHEGTGNLYSCALDGNGLRRHTDHDGWYARQASTDGQRVIYACGGELWLLDDLDADAPRRLDIVLGSPVQGRTPRLVSADDHVGSLSVDKSGNASAVEVRGTVHWLTHRDGPAAALAAAPGVRSRYPQVLGADGRVVWASDADGIDAIEIGGGHPGESAAEGGSGDSGPPRRLAAGQLGRIGALAAAPDGSVVAVAAEDGRLLVVNAASGQVRELASSANGRANGLVFSPDSAWLAWSQPTHHPGGMGEQPLRRLRLAKVESGEVSDVTDGRFVDTDPVFTHDGRFLAFLSRRSFDPIYDAHSFDLSFPYGARPYLVPLSASTPSPFAPQPGGRPIGDAKPQGRDGKGEDVPGDEPAAVAVDIEGITERVVALPVRESRYSRLRPVKGGLAWLREPVAGNLGVGGAEPTDAAPRPVLERFDFARRESSELAAEVDWFEASGDGTRIVVSDHGSLAVIPAERKADGANPDDRIDIDASRARFQCDPVAMWHQAYAEAVRIMRHDFWIPDMADVDWDAAAAQYRQLLDRITTTSEFVDVLWELFGELGTSHAYVRAPGFPGNGDQDMGLLGADLERANGGWRIGRVMRGESSDPRARSPLASPGTGIRAGDALLAIDGRPVGSEGPGPLLSGTAGKPVELLVAGADGGRPRGVVVVPLGSDLRLRYLDWVSRKRAAVHEVGGGRIGYLHVPDMVSEGWADFHRDLRTEMLHDALIIDVRANSGGHTSQLVVEKLARRIIGWDVPRALAPSTYPEDAPRGPIVALADECAGSDGDIVTAAIKILGLGPVVGARTWGGVIGYDEPHELADGTNITVPRLSFWFDAYGWEVENYGVDPDVEVIPTPDDWAAGRDVQLETAIELALAALRDNPAVRPPDPATRPSRRRPPLPPRSR